MFAKYAKAITALVGAAATLLVPALADGSISGAEWIGIVLALVTGGATAAIPNRPVLRVKPSVHDG